MPVLRRRRDRTGRRSGRPSSRAIGGGLIALATIAAAGSAAADHPAITPGLAVARDRHALVDGAGRPFYWLGDTAWDAFYALKPGELADYLAVRRDQGFNVVCVQLLGGDPRARDRAGHGVFLSGADGQPDVARPDPVFFAAARAKIDQINRAGFVATIVLAWGDNIEHGLFDVDRARAYGDFVARTFGDRNVVWMLGGDVNPPPAQMPIWLAMARGLRAGEPVHRPLSFHPTSGSSAQWFGDTPWLDFDTIQSGHARFRPRVKSIGGIIRADHDRQPPKPVIDLESGYEHIPDGLTGRHPNDQPVADADRLDDYDIRVRAYQALASGALGYTYGAFNVIQFWMPGKRVRWPPNDPWRQALHYRGATELGTFQRLRMLLGQPALVPADDLVPDTSKLPDYARTLAACTDDRRACIVYSTSGAPVRLRHDIAPTVRLTWIDPASGRAMPAATNRAPGGPLVPPSSKTPVAVPQKALRSPTDWVLLMRDHKPIARD